MMPPSKRHGRPSGVSTTLRLAMKVIAAEFGEKEVAAFQAYGLDGQDAAEVAAALGMSVGYVYTVKARILKRLKEIVQRQVEEEG